jgi:mRNA-degrading endonuclease YafQ of YafQ-DinJ toxin-antitoxin module
MPYKIIFTKSYTKRASQFFKKHPDLIGQYEKTLKLLELDPYHPSLGLHPLKGKLQSLHSVSINFTYRVTIELIVTEKTIIPVNIGTHEEAYR